MYCHLFLGLRVMFIQEAHHFEHLFSFVTCKGMCKHLLLQNADFAYHYFRKKSMCSSLPHSSNVYPVISLFGPNEARTEAAPCEALTDQTRPGCVFFAPSSCFLIKAHVSVSLQVGTLDVLVGLSDELAKLDSFVEGYGFFPFSLSRKTSQCKPSLQSHSLI